MKFSIGRSVNVVAVALGLMAVTACSGEKAAAPPAAVPPEVGVAVAQARDYREARRYPGRVRALKDIAIVPEISGRLTAIHVEDGATVAAGDLLFEIDPLPYEAELQRQKQLLEQARASLSIAETRQAMAKSLSRSEALSKLELEEINVGYQTAKAAEATAAAGLLAAELNLSRARIKAPTDGVIQEIPVDVGNVLSAGVGVLTSLVVDQQMEVYSEIDTQRAAETARDIAADPELSDRVLVLELEDGSEYPHKGRLNFQSDRVSPVTNTVTIRTVFPNPDGMLFDGQSVSLVARDVVPEQALLIPQAAVQQDQAGHYLLKVGEDNVVAKVYLQLGARTGSEWLVEKGLSPGDTYIVSGILKARPGQPVTPVQD